MPEKFETAFSDKKFQYMNVERTSKLWLIAMKKQDEEVQIVLGRFELSSDFQKFLLILENEGAQVAKINDRQYYVCDNEAKEEMRMTRVDLTPFRMEEKE